MNISVFGLGYVGSVSAACLARDGHDVVGVDTADAKVELINQGQTPVKVGVLGLSFKPGTDDLRERPLVEVGEQHR